MLLYPSYRVVPVPVWCGETMVWCGMVWCGWMVWRNHGKVWSGEMKPLCDAEWLCGETIMWWYSEAMVWWNHGVMWRCGIVKLWCGVE